MGPLRQASLFSSKSIVSEGIKLEPLFFSQYSAPASHSINSILLGLTASIILIVQEISSGPVPSPLITMAFFVKIIPANFYNLKVLHSLVST